nr:hypothetical protein 67 [Pelagibacteraceae bacterium]
MSNRRNIRIYDGHIEGGAPENMHQGLFHGRDTLTFRAWFGQNSGITEYITCSFITFFVNNGVARYLVWPYSPDATVTAHYDYDNKKIVIDRTRAVKHIAWYCGDRTTLLRSWECAKVPGVKAKERIWSLGPCPGDLDLARCRSIPELPRLGSFDEPAIKSTELFDVCVDIPALPVL